MGHYRQKRVSRAGIQPTKPISSLESTDVEKDGTIADLKPDSLPKLHDQGVTTPGGNMNIAPFEFISRAAPSRIERCGGSVLIWLLWLIAVHLVTLLAGGKLIEQLTISVDDTDSSPMVCVKNIFVPQDRMEIESLALLEIFPKVGFGYLRRRCIAPEIR